MSVISVASVYAYALRGHPCLVWHGDRAAEELPTHTWLGEADEGDLAVLAECEGPTVDIGCGPGRMSHALAVRGHTVMGIDVVPEAVRQSQSRGVVALVRDVFAPLPGEGRWGTALLADGNIGIGGDPVALLERARELIEPSGRVVVDVAPAGVGVVTRRVRLETVHGRSHLFPWTVVGADAIEAVAGAAGLALAAAHRHADRSFAVLERRP